MAIQEPPTHITATVSKPQKSAVLGALALIGALAGSLYWGKVVYPTVFLDDFQFIQDSLNWPSTIHNLLLPHNEHMSPVARLVTFACLRFGGLGRVALLGAIFSITVLVGNVLLLYRVLRLEALKEGPALAGAAVFGITQAYYEAVGWYSASFISLALLFILAGFIALEQALMHRSAKAWVAVNVCAVLAEASFSSGILAGVLFPIYAWLRVAPEKTGRLKAVLWTLPGTVVYLLVYIIFARPHMEHLSHYGGKSVFQIIGVWQALANTARALMDVTLLGNIGALSYSVGMHLPDLPCAIVTLGLLGWAIVATGRGWRLTALALWFLTLNLLLIFTFRTFVAYTSTVLWGRYHLFSQVGLAILIARRLDRVQQMQGMQGLRLAAGASICLYLARMFDGFGYFSHNPYITRGQNGQLAVYERVLDQARVAGMKPEAFAGSLAFPIAGYLTPGFSIQELYDAPPGATGDEVDLVAATEPLLQSMSGIALQTNFPIVLAAANERLENKLHPPASGSLQAIAKQIAIQGFNTSDGQNGYFQIIADNPCLTFSVAPGPEHYLFMNFRLDPGANYPLIARLAWSYDGSNFPADQQIGFLVNSDTFAAGWNLDAIPNLDLKHLSAFRLCLGASAGGLHLDRFWCQ